MKIVYIFSNIRLDSPRFTIETGSTLIEPIKAALKFWCDVTVSQLCVCALPHQKFELVLRTFFADQFYGFCSRFLLGFFFKRLVTHLYLWMKQFETIWLSSETFTWFLINFYNSASLPDFYKIEIESPSSSFWKSGWLIEF